MCELEASSEPPLIADKTENLARLRLVSHSTMALVTKPTFGLYYTNVTPHPSATAKLSGISKPRSMLLFILSISEQGLDETGENVLFVRVVLAVHRLKHSVSSVVSSCSLFLLPCTFWCEIAFLLLQTAASILFGEEAQSILQVKWQRRWQPP